MMHSFKLQVSLMRLLGCIKAAFANAFAIHHNLHQPFALVLTNTKKPAFVSLGCLTHVLQIAKAGYFAEVAKLVVLLITIAMVYVKKRRFSGHVQPRKPVSQLFFVVDGDSPISGIGRATSTFTNKIRAVVMCLPDKIARFWVVVKDGSNMVSGNHEFEFTIGATK